MVIDVDRERRLVEDFGIRAETAFVRAVDREHDALLRFGWNLARELLERHERVLAGQRGVTGEVHRGVLAQLPQREGRGEQ